MQSSRYNSFKIDPNESAKILRPAKVRREHWLKFMDLSAVAEETSNCNPLSVRRHAPLRDRLINFGKQLGDFATVASNVFSAITRPHWLSCSTYFANKCINLN
jgi:hypothetical protein